MNHTHTYLHTNLYLYIKEKKYIYIHICKGILLAYDDRAAEHIRAPSPDVRHNEAGGKAVGAGGGGGGENPPHPQRITPTPRTPP